MSRHYLALTQDSLIPNKDTITDALTALYRAFPEKANMLAKVDWMRFRKECMRSAIEEVAKEVDADVVDEYQNTDGMHTESGKPKKGECIGVIQDKHRRSVGVAMLPDGSAELFFNEYAKRIGLPALVKEKLKKAYQRIATERVLSILGCSVETHTQENTTVISASLPKKGVKG